MKYVWKWSFFPFSAISADHALEQENRAIKVVQGSKKKRGILSADDHEKYPFNKNR